MSRSLLPKAVERYAAQDIARETAIQKKLRAETARLPQAGMQIGADQGALLALLVRAIGAKKAIEIGSFSPRCGPSTVPVRSISRSSTPTNHPTTPTTKRAWC